MSGQKLVVTGQFQSCPKNLTGHLLKVNASPGYTNSGLH